MDTTIVNHIDPNDINPDDIEIRLMTLEDYEEVHALWMTIRGFGIRALDDSREDIQRFIRRNPTTSVVARMDGRIVGSILCGSDGRQGALYHVCVARDYRRRGIAKELLRRVVEEARAYGCGAVQITASDMGVLLYTDFGFVKNGNFMQYKL